MSARHALPWRGGTILTDVPEPAIEPNHIALAKSRLRILHLRRRDGLDAETRERLARRLAETGLDLVRDCALPSDESVASVFAPIGSEPDSGLLAAALASAGTKLSLPVDHSSGGRLIYRAWSPGDRVSPGPLGIAEPLEDAAEVVPHVMFVPMVTFDREGHRIGYGAGNVDSTLRALRSRHPVLAVGVAFAAQEEAGLPTTPHDEAVDFVITERELIDCRR